MHKLKVALIAAVVLAAMPLVSESRDIGSDSSKGNINSAVIVERYPALSPLWGDTISQWSTQIALESRSSGLDPDFIAAVINAESNGFTDVVSHAGAVGLMGVMPSGPGLEWRPAPEVLADPSINLNWGVSILGEIIRQSGGDVVAALAAYSGGWGQVDSRVPQEYAQRVLDEYGRAVAVRSNISPNIASQWTVGVEIRRGHIPIEPLILSERPVSGLRAYGEHLVYDYTDLSGRPYYVKGYAVPLALVVPIDSSPDSSGSHSVDKRLMARLGMSETKIDESNPRVILACLPSLSRLRGNLATKWYAPSSCPSWHR